LHHLTHNNQIGIKACPKIIHWTYIDYHAYYAGKSLGLNIVHNYICILKSYVVLIPVHIGFWKKTLIQLGKKNWINVYRNIFYCWIIFIFSERLFHNNGTIYFGIIYNSVESWNLHIVVLLQILLITRLLR